MTELKPLQSQTSLQNVIEVRTPQTLETVTTECTLTISNTTELSSHIDALNSEEKNHRRKLKAIKNAIKAVDRAREESILEELEYARKNLKLALMREKIEYENNVRFEKEQNK